jgi:AcrR family transcriptional regulator
VASTRDRLLTATNELFRRYGYNGTSLKQVTAAAAAPTGSLYHFFPGGKDELALAVITTSGEAYRQLFELIADAATDSANAVTDFFEGAATVLEETDYIDPCPIGTVAREVASTNDALRQATERVFMSWIDAAASRFEEEGLEREDAEQLATTIMATLEGGFVLARARRNAEPLRMAGRHMRRLVDQMMEQVRAT